VADISDLIPPILPKLVARVRPVGRPQEPGLFDGHDALFKRVVSTARVYGEYGVGASTEWVYANTNATIVAVETSPVWARSVLEGKDHTRISVVTGNLGEIGEWGRPLTYGLRQNFQTYTHHIWSHSPKPDTVLIDGRFRVCCFVTSLLNALPGCRIIFEDYCDRPHYHVVEEVLQPIERFGRQALFQVPEAFDQSLAKQIARDFRMVMD
jgi:hypothetical protein